MSVKATINGEVWEFSTVAEAAEFRRALANSPAPTPTPPRQPVLRPARRRGRPRKTASASPTRSVRTARTAYRVKLSDSSRQIVQAISQIPMGGMHSEDFARAIGSDSPAGIPVRMMMLGKELKLLGFKPEDVVSRKRTYVKGKPRSVYTVGPRLTEVLRNADEAP